MLYMFYIYKNIYTRSQTIQQSLLKISLQVNNFSPPHGNISNITNSRILHGIPEKLEIANLNHEFYMAPRFVPNPPTDRQKLACTQSIRNYALNHRIAVTLVFIYHPLFNAET